MSNKQTPTSRSDRIEREDRDQAKSSNDASRIVGNTGKFPEGMFDSARWWIRQDMDEWDYARLTILDIMILSHTLSTTIAEAFTSQVFWLEKAPDSPENLRRLNAYVEYQLLAGKLLGLGIELAVRFDQRPTKPTASAPKANTEKQDVDADRSRGGERKGSKKGAAGQNIVN